MGMREEKEEKDGGEVMFGEEVQGKLREKYQEQEGQKEKKTDDSSNNNRR